MDWGVGWARGSPREEKRFSYKTFVLETWSDKCSGTFLVWDGLGWFGMVWTVLGWFGLVWDGLGWFTVVWGGLGWFGMVWGGLGWFGVV